MKMEKSIVAWSDGSYLFVDCNSSWEYENDSNWLTTINLNLYAKDIHS